MVARRTPPTHAPHDGSGLALSLVQWCRRLTESEAPTIRRAYVDVAEPHAAIECGPTLDPFEPKARGDESRIAKQAHCASATLFVLPFVGHLAAGRGSEEGGPRITPAIAKDQHETIVQDASHRRRTVVIRKRLLPTSMIAVELVPGEPDLHGAPVVHVLTVELAVVCIEATHNRRLQPAART